MSARSAEVRLGSCYRVRDERAGAAADELPLLSVSQTAGVIPRADLSGDSGRAQSLTNYKIARPQDMVLNRMSAYNGALGVANQIGLVSPDYLVMEPRDGTNPDFVVAWLKTPAGIFEMTRRLRGIGSGGSGQVRTPRVNETDLRLIPIALPPFEDQTAIMDWVDRETARIDTLIEEQQRLIGLVRERQQALVEKAVYGGVQSAARRETSEDWLPPIRETWPVTQLGFVADTLPGWAFPSEGFTMNPSDTRLLRGVNVKPGNIDWTETVTWDADLLPVPADFYLKEGDLVFGMDRPFIGPGVRVASVTSNDLPALLLQRVLRIRAGERLLSDYLRYVVMTNAFLSYLEPLFTGVSVPHASEWQIRKFAMPLPPKHEQVEICAWLDQQSTKIGGLMTEAERFISLARERRAALITAAVTGQIDVRDPEPTEAT